jgi:hypothetical protein
MTERELIAALAALPRPDPPEGLRARLGTAIQAEKQATDRERDLRIEILRHESPGKPLAADGYPRRRGNVFRERHRSVQEGGTETFILIQEGIEPWK